VDSKEQYSVTQNNLLPLSIRKWNIEMNKIRSCGIISLMTVQRATMFFILTSPAERWCRDHGDRHVCRLKILEL